MKYIGAHVSAEGGVFNAPLNAQKICARAFACFTKNQKRWVANPYTSEVIAKFKENLEASKISPLNVLAHSGYLINLGQPDEEKRERSVNALIDELERSELLGIDKLVVHPGSHVNLVTEEECLDLIGESINKVLAATKKVTLVLENTAGQGSNMGYKFEHLASLLDKTDDKNRIGVCIDTCHLFSSGYDFRTKKKFSEVWDEFDRIIGFKYLKGMHLNDSKIDLGSKKDRHESIGKGTIGLEPFKLLMQDQRFDDIPLILETVDPDIWEQEIELLYSFCE